MRKISDNTKTVLDKAIVEPEFSLQPTAPVMGLAASFGMVRYE